MDKVIGNEHNINQPILIDLNSQDPLSLNVSSTSASDIEPSSGIDEGNDIIDPSLQVLPPTTTPDPLAYNSGRKLK
jgi:hypothetical protein